MKSKLWLIPIIAVVLLALILFTPIPQGSYDDGGTRDYNALTYKIVKWNKIMARVDENGETVHDTYKNTSVYWFPDNFKSIDELWEMEMADKKINSDLLKSRGAKSVSVTSLPEGYDYYYEGNDAKLIEDYLFDLNLIADFEENPDEYAGMAWMISLKYENGETQTVYHSCNMFIRSENEPWYKMESKEAHRFDALLTELNSKDDSEVVCKYLSEEDGVYTLTLPQSREVIELRDEQVEFVPYLTSNLVEAAERKISEDVLDYSNKSNFYLQITDNYLCLVVEVIKSIEPPTASDGEYVISGCGYDHEHLFFSERISYSHTEDSFQNDKTSAVDDDSQIVDNSKNDDVIINNTKREITLLQYAWNGWGISKKTVRECETTNSIIEALGNMKKTGEVVPAISDKAFNPDGGIYEFARGTMWIEYSDKIYRLNPDLSEICLVDGHFGKGEVLEITDEFKTDVNNAWYYAPLDYYKGTYNAIDGTVEMKNVYRSDSSVSMSIKDIVLENGCDIGDGAQHAVKVELTAKEDIDVFIMLESRQSDDNLAEGDFETVSLKKGIPTTVELNFGGWLRTTYWVYITVDNTRAEITMNP